MRRGRGGGAVLAGCALVLPPLAVMAPLGLAPLLAVVAVLLLLLDGRRAVAAIRNVLPLAVLLAALVAWGFASAAWSILPEHSLAEGLRLLAISAGGLVAFGAATALTAEERDRLGLMAAVGVAAAVVLLLIERASDGALARFALDWPRDLPLPLTRFDRGATTLVLALWPALMMAPRRWLEALLALAATPTVLLMESTTAKLAVVASLVVFAVALWAPRLLAGGLAAGILVAAVALPLAMPKIDAALIAAHDAPWLKFSARHRLFIWGFTTQRIAERPLLGWGLDASRELPGAHQDVNILFPGAGLPPGTEVLPLHPHNALLQWEVELGVPGTLLCLGIIGWGLWRVGFAAPLDRAQRAAALAWATAALPVALLSYGIWQEWWLSCLWLTAALSAGAARASPPAAAPDRAGR